MGQWRDVAPCLFGDFYPLTDYSSTSDAWMAWQFDRTEQHDGLLQTFRRSGNDQSSKVVRLQSLDDAAVYVVTNLDTASESEITGSELMEKGLAISIQDAPGSVLITYKKKP